ncbi:MAG TPA: hypothetical protein V6C65_07495, partial [Allocoleopsis sp.]
QPPSSPSSSQSLPSGSLESVPLDAIDSLLNELGGTARSSQAQSAASLASTTQPVNSPSKPSAPPPHTTISANSPLTADPLLVELKAQYAEQERQDNLKRQEQEQLEQQRREKRKRQQRIAAIKPAEDWLKKLDPRSGEAVWFEEFAAKYQSRVEAAIDYLGLVQEE